MSQTEEEEILGAVKVIDRLVLHLSIPLQDSALEQYEKFPYRLTDGRLTHAHKEAAIGAVLAMAVANPPMVAVAKMIENSLTQEKTS